MKNIEMAQKLNNLVSELKLQDKYGNLRFSIGNYIEETLEILSEVCPCGKIATLYFNSTYLEIGKQFSNTLKTNGYKPLSVIVPDDFSDSVDDYARLFTLPEDVRAIVTFDFNLNQAVKYFGALKNVQTIHVLRELKSAEFISPKILVKNKDKIEIVTLSCNQYVVVDDKICKIEAPKIYSYVVSKIISLIDYKVYSKLHSKKYIKTACDLLKVAIDRTLTCFNESIKRREELLLEMLFTTELANRKADGDTWLVSSEYAVKRLIEKFEGYDRIVFLKYTLNLYKKYFSGDYEHLLEIPDYNTRAYAVSKSLGVDEVNIMNNLLMQVQSFNLSTEKREELKRALFSQVQQAEKLVSQINSTYHALGGGGKENKGIRKSIYYSGDLNSTLNGMSLLRESGILEYLEV